MKLDTVLLTLSLSHMAAFTQAADAIGFDGLWVAEIRSNPFLRLTLAAEHSRRLSYCS